MLSHIQIKIYRESRFYIMLCAVFRFLTVNEWMITSERHLIMKAIKLNQSVHRTVYIFNKGMCDPTSKTDLRLLVVMIQSHNIFKPNLNNDPDFLRIPESLPAPTK